MQTVRLPSCYYHSALSLPQALASIQAQDDLRFEVFDSVVAEPTEESWRQAIAWARQHDFSHFLACVLAPLLLLLLKSLRIYNNNKCWRRKRDRYSEGG